MTHKCIQPQHRSYCISTRVHSYPQTRHSTTNNTRLHLTMHTFYSDLFEHLLDTGGKILANIQRPKTCEENTFHPKAMDETP